MYAAIRDDFLGSNDLVIGVDASRNRSGGAISHIRGLMAGDDPRRHGIARVHLWAHDQLLDKVQDAPWLQCHAVPATRRSILHQLIWQRLHLPRLARRLGVSVMFNTDAGSVCPFRPCATLSQDMLSFEPGEMQRYPWPGLARIRLEVLRIIQLHRLRHSTMAIFLSDHARRVIGRLTPLSHTCVINHGIDRNFFDAYEMRRMWPLSKPVRFLYISNAAPYKHQWNVVEAVALLRHSTGQDFRLRLVGGGAGSAMARLLDAVKQHDPGQDFVELIDFVPNNRIVDELAAADVFIYASSCENLPITLLEAMASGLPIVSSNRGPMPEVLGKGGVYFDPENPEIIADAIARVVGDNNLRQRICSESRMRAEGFTWADCAEKTWLTLAALSGKNLQ